MKLNLFNTSVDSILSTFTKTIAKLEQHADDQALKASKKRTEAANLHLKAVAAETEAGKAKAAALKLQNLFKAE